MESRTLSDLVSVVYRRWPGILLVVLGSVGASLVFQAKYTPAWRASAKLYLPDNPPTFSFSSEKANIPTQAPIPTAREDVQLGMLSLITSGAALERILEKHPEFTLQELRAKIVANITREKMLQVTATDPDMHKAIDLANEVLAAFRDLYKDLVERGPRSNLATFQEGLKTAEENQKSAQDAVLAFLDSLGSINLQTEVQRLVQERNTLRNNLEELDSNKKIRETRRPLLMEIIGERPEFVEASQSIGRNSAYVNTIKSLSNLEIERATLLLQFTVEHPKVVALDERMRVLREQAAGELEMIQTGSSLTRDEEVKRMLADLVNMDIAESTDAEKRGIYTARLADVEGKLKNAPVNIAELSRLNNEVSRWRDLASELKRRIYELELHLRHGIDFTYVNEYLLAREKTAKAVPTPQNVTIFAAATGLIVGVFLAVILEIIALSRMRRPF